MPIATRKQIRDSVLSSTQQLNTQIGDLVNDLINVTLQEIATPAWAFPNSNHHHLWSWLKRKTTFTTTASTSDYVLERDVDKIAILRQTSSPAKLIQLTDETFFRHIPNPNESGNPKFYRMWEIDGLSTRLPSADSLNMVSSSTSDSTTFTVTVLGYVSGRLETEVFTMNGTTTVTGSKTWDAREIFISKSGNTTGNITVKRVSNSATLLVLAPQEVSPRFKVASLYPIPGASITMYLEYYKRIRELVNDSDAPEFDGKWHHIVRLGTIAKVLQYLGKTQDFLAIQALYEKSVRSMVADDKNKPDLVEILERRDNRTFANAILHPSDDTIV